MVSLEVALGLAVVALGLLYYYLTSTFSHWKDKGVPFMKPIPLFGSAIRVLTLREHISDYFQKLYNVAGKNPFIGHFRGRLPGLLVKDPEIVKNILVKDYSHFAERIFKLDDDINSLAARNLFSLEGQRWKEMRTKLTPTFTSGRIKSMFPLVHEITETLETHLDTLANTGEDVDIRDVMARYTTDVIGSCAFGVKCDSINDPNSQFRVMGIDILDITTFRAIKRFATQFIPTISKIFRITILSDEVSKFFRTLVHDVIALRARTGETRKDFMQLLIELKDKGRLSPEEDETGGKTHPSNGHVKHSPDVYSRLQEDDVAAQAFLFFIAGFDTSSLSLTYSFLELARQPELQREARRQIEEVLQRHDGKMSYQALEEMTYLDWIMKEELRMYPPGAVLLRICNKKYDIPGHNVTIDKGTVIALPIKAMQSDPEYFKNPKKFDPDRFKDENQQSHVYMPFGDGPRQCIGLRFARMQVKMGLLSVLRKFEVQPSTRTKYPLTWSPRTGILITKYTVYLKLVRAQD